jgi:Putative transposase
MWAAPSCDSSPTITLWHIDAGSGRRLPHQGSQARAWLEARQAELLEAPYFHVVCTLPSRIGAIAFQNKAVIYDLLFKATAETLLAIAADPKRLGVKIVFTSVLHTWGSAMTHHPHVHMIVPGGGISLDGSGWISSAEDYLLPVPVLSRMFRVLAMLKTAHNAARLLFFGPHADLADKAAEALKAGARQMPPIADYARYDALRSRPAMCGAYA